MNTGTAGRCDGMTVGSSGRTATSLRRSSGRPIAGVAPDGPRFAITRRSPGLRSLAPLALVVVAAVAGLLAGSAGGARPAGATRLVDVRFTGPEGRRDDAVVSLPAWYGPGHDPKLPLIISPHSRGITPWQEARRWGDIPGRFDLIVVDTGLHGRVIPRRSWAWPPDIAEMAALPRVVHRSLPWIRYDPDRIYAAGDSMGAQETLMLLALHPDLLAAAVAADPVTNFLRRWYQFPISGESRGEQSAATREVGASPGGAPWLYVRRSPSFFAGTIAFSRVPLELWWNPHDSVVIREGRSQTGLFYADVKRLDPSAPVFALRHDRMHGWVFRYDHDLPSMVRFLLAHRRSDRPPSDFTYASWRPEAAVWGWRVTSFGSERKLWTISAVTSRQLQTNSPGPLLVSPPGRLGAAFVDGRRATLRDGAVPVPAGRHDVKLAISAQEPRWVAEGDVSPRSRLVARGAGVRWSR